MNRIERTMTEALGRATTATAKAQPAATTTEPTTYTQVQYRLGWVGTDGRWHALTAFPIATSYEEATANLEAAKVRYFSPTIVAEVRRAVKAGRIEVRGRVVVSTSWEVLA